MLCRIVLIFSFLFYISCAQKNEKNYQDLFRLRILLESATKAKPNPVATCQSSLTAMQACVATATEFSSSTLTETTLSATISFNKYFTYADYCNNSVINDPYRSMSDSLKECYFKCDTSYWQTRKNLNICTGSITTLTSGIFNDSGTTNCKRNCSSPTSNTP